VGNKFRSYSFITETTNPYFADNGLFYNVAAKIGHNGVVDDAVSQAIVVAAGANFQAANTPANICDNEAGNSWLTPRFIEFEYNTGTAPDILTHKMKVVLSEIGGLIVRADEIKTILEAAGGRVRCIKLLGEKFTNILYEVGPIPLPAFAQATRFNSRPLYTGIFSYESDLGDLADTYLPFSMATDVARAAPSVIDVTEGFTPLPNTRCGLKYSSIKIPRHVVVTTQHTEGTQKTIVPIAADDAGDIGSAQSAFAALPHAVCVKYEGETNFKVAKYLP
jgi:hypothetical protein